MPQITIRKLQGEEMFTVLFDATTYAFNPSPPIRDKDEWEARFAKRAEYITVLAVFEDESPVATVASTPMIQNVRGAKATPNA
ncbi:MAG: hypothetical protein HN413_01645 [Chloroflexi bacterium]|jgi:hypothetical protein|nr:hypothetical protein [Chloroflexota bacterium]